MWAVFSIQRRHENRKRFSKFHDRTQGTRQVCARMSTEAASIDTTRNISTDLAAVKASVLEMINDREPILLVIDGDTPGDTPTVWMIADGKYAGPVLSAVLCDKHAWFWVKVGTHLIHTVNTVMHCNVKINRNGCVCAD